MCWTKQGGEEAGEASIASSRLGHGHTHELLPALPRLVPRPCAVITPRKWAPSSCPRASPSPICASVELAMAGYLSRARTHRDHLCALSKFVHTSASHSNPSQP